jgi:hypothetical protein
MRLLLASVIQVLLSDMLRCSAPTTRCFDENGIGQTELCMQAASGPHPNRCDKHMYRVPAERQKEEIVTFDFESPHHLGRAR